MTSSRSGARLRVGRPFTIGKTGRVPPEILQPGGRIDDRADGELDFYGNDVTAAVATYRLDATGSLYESHAPNIELPRLGSPNS